MLKRPVWTHPFPLGTLRILDSDRERARSNMVEVAGNLTHRSSHPVEIIVHLLPFAGLGSVQF
jgi:hypothetical protein